jgi:hypothetical protein
MMAYDEVVAIPTLVGSLVSATASLCILICFAIWRRQQQTFRHALVFNLALSGKYTNVLPTVVNANPD